MIFYIDGTTGGMMLQIVLAGVVGGFVAIKLLAGNFVSSVVGHFKRPKQEDDSPETGPTDQAS